MDKTRIIQQGEIVKFSVDIKDFDMMDEEFTLELIYGYRRHVMEIPKSKMIPGFDDKWYFTIDTADMAGRVTARMKWYVPDDDIVGGLREKVDEQYLCVVVTAPCPQFLTCPACTEDHDVTYERTEQSDVADDYQVLCDSQKHKFITTDDEYILVLRQPINA